jgi:type II secretory pathway pseudopilin PulG
MESLTDPQTPAAASTPRRDRGSTFTEVLVAIVLMGIAFSAVIAGIRTIIAASSTSDDQAKVEAVLNSASDRLANWAYKPCPGANGEVYAPIVSAASSSVGWENSTVAIVSVEYWDPSNGGANTGDLIDADGSWSATNSFAGAGCNEDINLTTSRTLQKIRVSVTSPNGEITRVLDVVKSNVVADPTSTTTTTTTTP